ncbi:MAG: hypothetical protein R3D44_06080 [Hyphomicrobiaceae bacterium]
MQRTFEHYDLSGRTQELPSVEAEAIPETPDRPDIARVQAAAEGFRASPARAKDLLLRLACADLRFTEAHLRVFGLICTFSYAKTGLCSLTYDDFCDLIRSDDPAKKWVRNVFVDLAAWGYIAHTDARRTNAEGKKGMHTAVGLAGFDSLDELHAAISTATKLIRVRDELLKTWNARPRKRPAIRDNEKVLDVPECGITTPGNVPTGTSLPSHSIDRDIVSKKDTVRAEEGARASANQVALLQFSDKGIVPPWFEWAMSNGVPIDQSWMATAEGAGIRPDAIQHLSGEFVNYWRIQPKKLTPQEWREKWHRNCYSEKAQRLVGQLAPYGTPATSRRTGQDLPISPEAKCEHWLLHDELGREMVRSKGWDGATAFYFAKVEIKFEDTAQIVDFGYGARVSGANGNELLRLVEGSIPADVRVAAKDVAKLGINGATFDTLKDRLIFETRLASLERQHPGATKLVWMPGRDPQLGWVERALLGESNHTLRLDEKASALLGGAGLSEIELRQHLEDDYRDQVVAGNHLLDLIGQFVAPVVEERQRRAAECPWYLKLAFRDGEPIDETPKNWVECEPIRSIIDKAMTRNGYNPEFRHTTENMLCVYIRDHRGVIRGQDVIELATKLAR